MTVNMPLANGKGSNLMCHLQVGMTGIFFVIQTQKGMWLWIKSEFEAKLFFLHSTSRTRIITIDIANKKVMQMFFVFIWWCVRKSWFLQKIDSLKSLVIFFKKFKTKLPRIIGLKSCPFQQKWVEFSHFCNVVQIVFL